MASFEVVLGTDLLLAPLAALLVCAACLGDLLFGSSCSLFLPIVLVDLLCGACGVWVSCWWLLGVSFGYCWLL